MGIIRAILVGAVLVLLAGCEEEDDAPLWQSEFPDLLSEQREACEGQGGTWGKAPGKTRFVCFTRLRDANARCNDSGDCRGVCLARSNTCSPVEPFFGCHEVITNDGFRQTVCIE